MFGTTEFDADYIRIFDDNDYELFYWDRQEWIDEPDLVFTIARVIRDIYTHDCSELRTWGGAWEYAFANAGKA